MTFNPQLIWFLVGLALVLFEFMIPGVILVFFGMGAWTAAITSWLGLTTGWASELLVFAISSIIYLVLLRRWFKARFIGFEGDRQNPSDNIDEFKGQVVFVTEDIDPGSGTGKVEFKGADWAARSDGPIAAGQRVRITSVDSITLMVEPE
jgi:inner membrane protein